MGKTFIEFVDQIIEMPDNTTCKEAWLIAYNNKKEIHNLCKLWSCVNDLDCSYSEAHMKQLGEIILPYVNFLTLHSDQK